MGDMGNTRRRYLSFSFPVAPPKSGPSIYKTIGHNFRERRKELGLTQVAVANELGYNRAWVRRLEMGKTCFDLGQYPQVKALLQLKDISDLMGD